MGTRDEIFRAPRHPYAWGLLESIPRPDVRVERLVPIEGSPPSLIHLPPGCAFHPRCPHRFERCDREVPPLTDEDGSGHRDACLLSVEDKRRLWAERQQPLPGRRGVTTSAQPAPQGPVPAPDPPPLVEVEGLTKHFPITQGIIFQKQIGAVQAVVDVTLHIGRGETLGLVGESGCGKLTTARLITRLLEPTGGTVRFDGRDITHLSRARSCARCGARCRWSSRTRTGRSTRATRWGRSSRRRSASTTSRATGGRWSRR